MSREYSALLLAERVRNDPKLQARLQANPASELSALADQAIRETAPVLQTDVWIYRMVVGALGLAVLSALVGAIALAVNGVDKTPDILTAIGSAAVGALAGLLAPPPSSHCSA